MTGPPRSGHLTDAVWYVQENSQPQPDPTCTSNAEETDKKIWLHVKQTTHRQILHTHLNAEETDTRIWLNVKQTTHRQILNAEETDTRIWLQVKQFTHRQIFLLSPDSMCTT